MPHQDYATRRCDYTTNRLTLYAAVAASDNVLYNIHSNLDFLFFFFSDGAPPEFYPLSLHAAFPILPDDGAVQKARLTDGGEASVSIGDRELRARQYDIALAGAKKHYRLWFDAAGTPVKFSVFDSDRKSTRLNSSHSQISYAVFCLKT